MRIQKHNLTSIINKIVTLMAITEEEDVVAATLTEEVEVEVDLLTTLT